jgi:hypothetical protein
MGKINWQNIGDGIKGLADTVSTVLDKDKSNDPKIDVGGILGLNDIKTDVSVSQTTMLFVGAVVLLLVFLKK